MSTEQEQSGESRSRFLIKNMVNGLIWLAVILVGFVLAEDFIVENFTRHIDVLKDKPFILFSIFFASEVVFGIIPPVLFMSTWKVLINIPLGMYVFFLSLLAIISFVCGVIGFYIGRNFSKTNIYKRIEEKYLLKYNSQLRKYGVFLVIVGALTPVPFSATCMLAGSVHTSQRAFLMACSTRVFYFIIYGWITWSFPGLFS